MLLIFSNRNSTEYYSIEIALNILGLTRAQYDLMNKHDFDMYKNISIATTHVIYILINYKKKQINQIEHNIFNN